MKKFINKKFFTLFVILIICTSIFTNSSQAAQIPHYHDGMNFNDRFMANPGFGDVYPPNYYYEDIWRVEVDGVVMGNMGFLRPVDPDFYNFGRTFAHLSTIERWASVFNGNPSYVVNNVKTFELTRTDGQKFVRAHSVEIGRESGAYVVQKKDSDGVNYVEVTTTPYPKGTLTVPAEVEAGKNFNVKISAEEFNPFAARIEWDIYVGNTLKATRAVNQDKTYGEYTPIQIQNPGQYTISVKIRDDVHREITLSQPITVKPSTSEPDPEPEPPPIPEPIPNDPPIARIDSVGSVKAGDYIDVTGINSTDRDGFIVQYNWSIYGVVYDSVTGGHTGKLMYDSIGAKNLSLTVVDDKGDTDTTYHTINVLPPTPEATLKITDDSTQKENRKVTLDASDSKTPVLYPIKWDESEWTVTPLDGQAPASIKIDGSTTGGQKKDMLFKEVGRYEAKVKVVNQAGLSDEFTILLDIQPDKKPYVNFSTKATTYRDKTITFSGDKILAPIEVTNLSKSNDDDFIKKSIYSLTYDVNNDGNYSEYTFVLDSEDLEKNQIHSFSHPNIDMTVYAEIDDHLNLTFYAPDIGRWKIDLESVEGFGQPTIPKFVLGSDYRGDDTSSKPLTEKTITIDNQAPTVQWGP